MDYIKSLRTVLEYAPHIEHLSSVEWVDLVKFCCDGMEMNLTLFDEKPATESIRADTADTPPVLTRNSSSMPRTSVIVLNTRLRSETEELMICLQLLLQMPNTPIVHVGETSEKIASSAILDFLESQTTLTSAHVPAFSSLNSILATISTNNINLAGRISRLLPRIVSRLWELKSASLLKGQMLISLIYALPHVRANIWGIHNDDKSLLENLRRDLDDLLTALMREYTMSTGRMAKEQLQLEDLEFHDPLRTIIAANSPLALIAFSLRAEESHRSEQTWMTLQLIATLVSILDLGPDDVFSVEPDSATDSENERPQRGRKRKRRKVARKFDEIFQQISSTSAKKKIVALQIMPFLLEERRMNKKAIIGALEWSRIMADLSLVASEDHSATSSWALLGIARSVSSRTKPSCGHN